MHRILITAVLACIFAAPAQAVPISFNLDDLLSGATEQLPDVAADCRPGARCTRTTRQRVVLNKPPASSPPSGFPDVGLTPTPGGPVPVPYPNIGGEINFNTGDFSTPDGLPATLAIEDIVITEDFVAFTIAIDSEVGYRLPSLTFAGFDAGGNHVERTLAFTIPEPATIWLFLFGVLAMLLARRPARSVLIR